MSAAKAAQSIRPDVWVEMADQLNMALSRAWLLRLALLGAQELLGEITTEALIVGAQDTYEDLEKVSALLQKHEQPAVAS